MVMGPQTVAAEQIALGLGAVSPLTGPAAPFIAAAALIIGIGVPLFYALDAWRSSRGTAAVAAVNDVNVLATQVIQDPVGREALASAGYDAVVVQAQLRADLVARTAEALAPGALPYFRAPDEARAWRDYILQVQGSGVIDGATLSNALAWSSVEISRLELGVSEALQSRDPTAYIELLHPPTFATYDQAAQWLTDWESLMTAGELSQPGISRVYSHYQAEVARLASLTPTAPPPAPTAPAAPAAPGVLVVPPELTAAITQITTALATLQASGAASRAQVDAMSAQIAALTTVATMPRGGVLADPAITGALGGLGMVLGGTGQGSLSRSMSQVQSESWELRGEKTQHGSYRSYSSLAPAWLDVARKLVPAATMIGGMVFKNPLRDAIDGVMARMLETVLDPERFAVATTPKQAYANAAARLREAITFGTEAQSLAMVAELSNAAKYMGLSQVAGFLGELAGFKRVADSVMGTVEDAAIYQPLRYEANKRFRPRLPDMNLAREMFQKRAISEPELVDILERQGLPDYLVEDIPAFSFTDLRLAELIRVFGVAQALPPAPSAADQAIMGRAGIATKDPDWYFKLKLAQAGYDPTDIHTLILPLKMGLLRRQQNTRYTQVARLYREGYITRDRAQAEIIEANMPAEVLDYHLASLDLEQENEVKEDVRQLVLALVARGRLDRARATKDLGALGMDGTRANIQVMRAMVNLPPRSIGATPAPAVEASALVEAE